MQLFKEIHLAMNGMILIYVHTPCINSRIHQFYIIRRDTHWWCYLFLTLLWICNSNPMNSSMMKQKIVEIKFSDHLSRRKSLKIHYRTHGSNKLYLLTCLLLSFLLFPFIFHPQLNFVKYNNLLNQWMFIVVQCLK